MELNVNNYVRTKDGTIAKIKSLFEKEDYIFLDVNNYICGKQNIIKSAEGTPRGLLSLIEVGDYVNGYKIIELATNIDGKVLYLETDITEFDNVYACGQINIYEKDIKSIVTHEQFENISYKVGE